MVGVTWTLSHKHGRAPSRCSEAPRAVREREGRPVPPSQGPVLPPRGGPESGSSYYVVRGHNAWKVQSSMCSGEGTPGALKRAVAGHSQGNPQRPRDEGSEEPLFNKSHQKGFLLLEL